MEAESSAAAYGTGQIIDRKGKGRALHSNAEQTPSVTLSPVSTTEDEGSWKSAWRRSRRRAQADKTSWDYSKSLVLRLLHEVYEM